MLKKLLICTLFLSFPLFAQPILTIYTYSSFASQWGPGPAIKSAFEPLCQCQLKFVALEDGVSLLNRLRLEGKNTQADVVVGLDNNLLSTAERTQLFAAHKLDTSSIALPLPWNNPLFVPYDYSYFAFIYNKETVTQPPRSMDELIRSKTPWKIVYQDPRTSTPGLGLLLWIKQIYGDRAAEAWQQLAGKTLTVTKGWSEAYNLLLRGEADLVMSYLTSPAYHLAEGETRYQAASFQEGHYIQIEVAGVINSSKQPELARQFIQFLLSPTVQQLIPTTNWMYPVINVPLPDSFSALTMPNKTLLFSAAEVEQQRKQWVDEWLRAVTR